MSGRAIKELLATSCMLDRIEYMLNEARFLHTLSPAECESFQRGVCGNESFHLEVKHAFNGQSMHPAVLDMKKDHLQMRKLLAHNVAVYWPTVKPMDELEIVHQRVASFDPWKEPDSWAKFCNQRKGNIKSKTIKERDLQQQRLSKWRVATKTKHTMARMNKWMKYSVFNKPKGNAILRR